MEYNVLFKTISGSRLYGLEHEDSDYDYYTVVDKVKNRKAHYTKQTIIDDQDSTVVDFGTWVDLCQKNTPQALEAMFSQKAEIDHIKEFREAFRAGTNFDVYIGIIERLYREHPDSYKHKRHMLRLALNMNRIRKFGRFNPTLNRLQIQLVNSLAKLPAERVYDDAILLAWR